MKGIRARLATTTGALLAVLALLGQASPASAACTPSNAGSAAERLRAAIQEVPCATSRYAATDSGGATLAGLKVIQVGTSYVGVYHAINAGRFELYVGTSTDLLHWTRRATLDKDSSQGTIGALPDGGFLVAYEWGNLLDVLPLVALPQLYAPPPLAIPTSIQGLYDSLPRIRIRFRHYPSLARLLSGIPSREFTAPRTLAATAEGTPNLSGVTIVRSTPLLPMSQSRIDIGMHYFADLNGDGFPDADRQATGALVDFSSWSTRDAPALNAAFAQLPPADRHPDYAGPPVGNYGDRDLVVLAGQAFQVHEAQYIRNDFGSWRPFLLDYTAGSLKPLLVRTHAGSTAFGNPTVTPLAAPGGAPAVLVSMFVFGEGAAPAESGQLVYYRTLGSP